jgi:hypothetical protein
MGFPRHLPVPTVYLSPMPLFDLYWRVLGLPLSRIKGAVTDAIPFSIVEVALWIGTAATLLFALSFLPRLRSRLKPVRRIALWAGPIFLIALGLGQGAFPGSVAPTAWRAPLTQRLGQDSLAEPDFRNWVAQRETTLIEALRPPEGTLRWEAFQSLEESRVLAACDTSLDAVLADLNLPAGRTVRTYKNMGPWTATIGLAYGGPAFHDPFFGEIAIVRDLDLPAPHFWRLIAACHEAAHAKGFTREMDAEILTQLALLRIADSRFRTLANIHFLMKTGTKIAWPESLIAESKQVRARRVQTEAHQPMVRGLRTLARRLGLQNEGVKYGARAPTDVWNPRHPFFATVRHAAPRLKTGGEHGRE